MLGGIDSEHHISHDGQGCCRVKYQTYCDTVGRGMNAVHAWLILLIVVIIMSSFVLGNAIAMRQAGRGLSVHATQILCYYYYYYCYYPVLVLNIYKE